MDYDRNGWVTGALVGILAAAALGGCAKHKSDAPKVLIDEWWNADYARNGCAVGARNGKPCNGDGVAEVQSFDAQLVTSFASDVACQGVQVATFAGPSGLAPPKLARDPKTRWLMIDFVPGNKIQAWSMTGRDAPRSTEGKGTPDEIAHIVCAVVKQRGSAVEN